MALAALAGIAAAAETIPLKIKGRLFTRIETARTDDEQRRGLMERDSLPEDGGMLFIQKSPRILSFWMRNTRIPLDLIYIDRDGTVIAVFTMKTEPPQRSGESDDHYCRRLPGYMSPRPALYALELKAGTAANLGIRPGDIISLPPFRAN